MWLGFLFVFCFQPPKKGLFQSNKGLFGFQVYVVDKHCESILKSEVGTQWPSKRCKSSQWFRTQTQRTYGSTGAAKVIGLKGQLWVPFTCRNCEPSSGGLCQKYQHRGLLPQGNIHIPKNDQRGNFKDFGPIIIVTGSWVERLSTYEVWPTSHIPPHPIPSHHVTSHPITTEQDTSQPIMSHSTSVNTSHITWYFTHHRSLCGEKTIRYVPTWISGFTASSPSAMIFRQIAVPALWLKSPEYVGGFWGSQWFSVVLLLLAICGNVSWF